MGKGFASDAHKILSILPTPKNVSRELNIESSPRAKTVATDAAMHNHPPNKPNGMSVMNTSTTSLGGGNTAVDSMERVAAVEMKIAPSNLLSY